MANENGPTHKSAATKLSKPLRLLFSVIYSFDLPAKVSVRRFLPKGRAWRQTEGDEQYDYDYLEGEWKHGKHRKLVAVLTRKQFENFVNDACLVAEKTPTMGSLGAPGLGLGLSPAVSFRGDDQDAILSAYVTPFPDRDEVTRELTEHDWDRCVRALTSTYQ